VSRPAISGLCQGEGVVLERSGEVGKAACWCGLALRQSWWSGPAVGAECYMRRRWGRSKRKLGDGLGPGRAGRASRAVAWRACWPGRGGAGGSWCSGRVVVPAWGSSRWR
jgi:hypothetical protein